MNQQTTVFFENDGINTIAFGKSGSGETVTIDRANGIGMSAGELLLMSLAYCTLGTVREYLTHKYIKKLPLRVEADCTFDDKEQKYINISLLLRCPPNTSERLKTAMLNAAKACRIHKTLHGGPSITVALVADLGQATHTSLS